MSEEVKNPGEYGYDGTEELTISPKELMSLKGAIEYALNKETTVAYPEKYVYIDTETGKNVKNVSEKNKQKVKKVADIQKTLHAEPTITRTAEGIQLLRVKLLIDEIHMRHVDAGVAKHHSELEAKPLSEAKTGDTIEGSDPGDEQVG